MYTYCILINLLCLYPFALGTLACAFHILDASSRLTPIVDERAIGGSVRGCTCLLQCVGCGGPVLYH